MSKRQSITCREFIAYDGEGIGPAYVLLADSTGRSIYNRGGLGMAECLDFLGAASDDPNVINVWFSFSYDVNMILRGIDSAPFWRGEEKIKIHGWTVEYRPGQTGGRLTLQRGKRRVTHYDLFGFFQCSFIDVCRDWLGAVDQTIVKGKEDRADFSKWTRAQLERYNGAELRDLAEIARRLDTALQSIEPPIELHSFHGPGAVASLLLSKVNTVKEIKASINPPNVDWLADRAYFGGRIELITRGDFKNVWHGDIRSAFPAAMLNLPDLSRCIWRKTDHYEGDKIGVYAVNWSQPLTDRIGVLPYRYPNRAVVYPLIGSGCYWGEEVGAAIDAGAAVEVVTGYVIDRFYESELSGAVANLYALRAAYRVADDPRHMAIKLVLNSLYGKMAQRPTEIAGRSRAPVTRSLILAGLITARVRAWMLRAAAQRDDVICFATDGLYCKSARTVSGGLALGQWDVERIPRAVFVQAGFYRFDYPDGVDLKSRGFNGDEIDFDRLLSDLKNKGVHTIEVTRFVTNLLHLAEPKAYPNPAVWIKAKKTIQANDDYKRTWLAEWGRRDWRQSRPMAAGYEPSSAYTAKPYKRSQGVTDYDKAEYDKQKAQRRRAERIAQGLPAESRHVRQK